MQAFFFHPRFGAVAAIHGDCRPNATNSHHAFMCPRCHNPWGPWHVSGPIQAEYCRGCMNDMRDATDQAKAYELDKKDVDKSPSLIHNTGMCMNNLRFVTAVLVAVGDLRTAPFSVFNITTKLRKQVNDGELAFTDKTPETIDGVGTYRVDHQEVREVFNELRRSNVLTGLTSRDTGSYMEYANDTTAQVVPSPTTTGMVTCAGQVVQPPINPRAGHTLLSVVAQPTALPPDAALRQKVQDYLKGRSGQDVTMKEIQSRFKGVSKTCQDWGKLIADMGLPVNTQGTPSFWTARI